MSSVVVPSINVSSLTWYRFLLAVLQFNNVVGQVTRQGVRQALQNLSGNLAEVYEKTIHKTRHQSPDRCDLAMKALLWVAHAQRPLLASELRHALAIQVGDRELNEMSIPTTKMLLEICHGLIPIEHESSEVCLVHYTLQEYLLEAEVFQLPQADVYIALTCLTQFLFKTGPGQSSFRRHVPFFNYAVQYWGVHVRNAQLDENAQSLSLLLLQDDVRLQRLTRPMKTTGLHVAAEFGLTGLSAVLLQQSANVTCKDDQVIQHFTKL